MGKGRRGQNAPTPFGGSTEMTHVVTERTYKKLPFTLKTVVQTRPSPVMVLVTLLGEGGTPAHPSSHSLQDCHHNLKSWGNVR